MKEIGGYFELELPISTSPAIPPGIALNSGRHALEYILLSHGEKVQHILLPLYTCDVVLEPLKRLKIPYTFYHINENLELNQLPELKDGDFIIINNYFGIKDKYLDEMIQVYKDRLIIDNSQAWYYIPSEEANSFYSPRKFFGLPDGGVAHTTNPIFDVTLPEGYSLFRFSHLIKRIDEGATAGYDDFKKNSLTLKNEGITRMSRLTKRLLLSIDFDKVKSKRRQNYTYLHNFLGESNILDLPKVDNFECPLVYPYMSCVQPLRQKMILNGIYVATYWPNVTELCPDTSIEFNLAKYIIPIPLDQRYGIEHLKRIINIIKDANQD